MAGLYDVVLGLDLTEYENNLGRGRQRYCLSNEQIKGRGACNYLTGRERNLRKDPSKLFR